MVGWYCWLNGHEFGQALRDGGGQGSLVCSSPWGRKELDSTEKLKNNSKIYVKQMKPHCSILSIFFCPTNLWPSCSEVSVSVTREVSRQRGIADPTALNGGFLNQGFQKQGEKNVCLSLSYVCLLQPHDLLPAGLFCPWDSPGKNTGVGCHSLLQGIFSTQGSKQISCIADSLLSEPQGKPRERNREGIIFLLIPQLCACKL